MNGCTNNIIACVKLLYPKIFCVIYAEFLSFLNVCISQGNVAAYLKFDVNFYTHFLRNFILIPAVKEFWKLINISQS